jgi:hypothetical protein
MTEAVVGDATGSLRCVWFSKNVLENLNTGNEYIFEGYLENKYGRLALQKPTYTLTKENQREYKPVQPLQSAPRTYPLKRSLMSADDAVGLIIGIVFVAFILYGVASWIQTTIHNRQVRAEGGVTCRDVTSIDYNWNNDVLCTNLDGSTFYTNYAGGNKYGYSFPN